MDLPAASTGRGGTHGRNETVDHGRRHLLHLAGGGLGLAVLGTGPARAWAQTTPASATKIGSVGAGRMGGALGALFIKAGYPVMFSSRHPEESRRWRRVSVRSPRPALWNRPSPLATWW